MFVCFQVSLHFTQNYIEKTDNCIETKDVVSYNLIIVLAKNIFYYGGKYSLSIIGTRINLIRSIMCKKNLLTKTK